MAPQFTFADNFISTLPKPDLTKIENRQELINKFLQKRDFIDAFLEEFIEFIQLERMYTDVTEEIDLVDITDNIRLSMGCLGQAWDDMYAFNQRVHEEQLLVQKGRHGRV